MVEKLAVRVAGMDGGELFGTLKSFWRVGWRTADLGRNPVPVSIMLNQDGETATPLAPRLS